MLRVLLAFVLLNSAIAIHEFGHYATMEHYGVDVEAVSWGFGPVLQEWDVGDFNFRISAIPLGAYVKASENGVVQMSTLSAPKKFVISGAGIFLNWVVPLLVLLILSKKYRRFDKKRNKFPPTLFRKRLLKTRMINLPIIGPFHIARALYAPMIGVSTREEIAWKFSDVSRLLGFVNMVPILGLDGDKMLQAITRGNGSVFAIIMFLSWFFVWWTLWGDKNPPVYRRFM